MDSEVVHGISLSWWKDVTWRMGKGCDLGPFLVPNLVNPCDIYILIDFD